MLLTHVLAHLIIFLAYLAAVFRVPPSFRALMKLRLITMVSGAGFFLFCGLTHFGLALGKSDLLFFEITDHLQAVSIVTFLLTLSIDLQNALTRLRLAFQTIRHAYGKDGERMIATVTAALQGTDSYDRHSRRH
jgi:hypothetical protein